MIDGKRQPELAPVAFREGDQLTPAWREFIRFCRDLRHGEIERLSIQDGMPVLAETIKKNLNQPDETRTFPKGKVEVVKVGDLVD